MCVLSAKKIGLSESSKASPHFRALGQSPGPVLSNSGGFPSLTGGVEPQVWIKEALLSLIAIKPEGAARWMEQSKMQDYVRIYRKLQKTCLQLHCEINDRNSNIKHTWKPLRCNDNGLLCNSI